MYKYDHTEKCTSCDSHKLVNINAKCSDLCVIDWYPDPRTGHRKSQRGYVPDVLGLGEDSDYLEFQICIDCGLVQDYKEDIKCKECGR